uniref:Uncharacterized protein n=1 Tax=Brassica campestris TaxID=3711 RepID=M4CNU7_BRACM
MKLKVVYRKVSDYIRYDLKEIVLPSSLPDPPHVVKRRKLTWHERFLVLKEASRLYGASWVRDIGPELRPNDYKKQGDAEPKKQAKETEKEPSVFEDLAVAARGGIETLRALATGDDIESLSPGDLSDPTVAIQLRLILKGLKTLLGLDRFRDLKTLFGSRSI